MNKSYFNIERSSFRRGEYVGYSKAGTARIVKDGNGWMAYYANSQANAANGLVGKPISWGRTLAIMSAKLESMTKPELWKAGPPAPTPEWLAIGQ